MKQSPDGQRRIRVAVVFGGRSSEHAISCVSAGSVIGALDPERYDVVPVGITTDGRWVLADPDQPLAITDGKLPEVTGGTPVTLVGDPAGRGLAGGWSGACGRVPRGARPGRASPPRSGCARAPTGTTSTPSTSTTPWT